MYCLSLVHRAPHGRGEKHRYLCCFGLCWAAPWWKMNGKMWPLWLFLWLFQAHTTDAKIPCGHVRIDEMIAPTERFSQNWRDEGGNVMISWESICPVLGKELTSWCTRGGWIQAGLLAAFPETAGGALCSWSVCHPVLKKNRAIFWNWESKVHLNPLPVNTELNAGTGWWIFSKNMLTDFHGNKSYS